MSRDNRPRTQMTRRTTRTRRRWVTAVVVVLGSMAALLTVPLTVTEANAVNRDGSSTFATYNMHGSDNGSRWTSEINRLVASYPVVMLQEAGSGPPPAVGDHRTEYRSMRIVPSRSPQPSNYTISTWAGGPNHENRYVYYLQTDPRRISNTNEDTWDGGQMNLATVTDTRADEVRVLENAYYDPDPNAPNNRYRARPLLGLQFGSTWYWNTHARGEDVTADAARPGLLDRVRGFMAGSDQRGRNWVLAGDYNVNILNRTNAEARDRSLHLRPGEALLRTGQPTFINSDEPSELDYAVTSGLPGGFTASRSDGAGSDHVAVVFARTPPPVAPTGPSHVYATTLATPNGNMLQVGANHSMGIGAPRYDSGQIWRMYTNGDSNTHFLRNPGTGDCIAAPTGSRRDTSSRAVAGDCADPRAQWTISHMEDDPGWNSDTGGPQRWQSVAFPGMCLTPSNQQVTVERCTDDPAQRWWDNPASLPKDWPTTTGNVRLEDAARGSRLRRSGSVPGTGVATRPTPPKWWWLYWLAYERRDFGWNIQRIDTADNLVRIQSLDGDNRCLGVRDEHTKSETDALLRTCDDARGADGSGQRWLAENYADGTVRYRNEANHLCLTAPDAYQGNVKLYSCNDIRAERWSVVNP
ncbi:ricin-type beta-trefoil lectin domain protein [Streptomyces sp. NPDC051994]|uniref:ricin-type beta-trefoil lectin domain protein n=1 Tax=unclassified Streptomyces TaxID=2593676 RepID=UPI00344A8E26